MAATKRTKPADAVPAEPLSSVLSVAATWSSDSTTSAHRLPAASAPLADIRRSLLEDAPPPPTTDGSETSPPLDRRSFFRLSPVSVQEEISLRKTQAHRNLQTSTCSNLSQLGPQIYGQPQPWDTNLR